MKEMTQTELSVKYNVTVSFVCAALKGFKPTGSRPGPKREMKTYPEKEAAKRILDALKERAGKKKAAYDEAQKEADYVEGVMRANGLIDNTRWHL